MNKPRVYLAGPIARETYDSACGWRHRAKVLFEPEIECFDPMRCKEKLKQLRETLGTTYAAAGQDALLSPQAIVSRDFADVKRADLILFNLTQPEKLSVGTLVELGWASALGKTIVVWVSKIPEHPFLTVLPSVRVYTLDDAVRVSRSFLLSADEHQVAGYTHEADE